METCQVSVEYSKANYLDIKREWVLYSQDTTATLPIDINESFPGKAYGLTALDNQHHNWKQCNLGKWHCEAKLWTLLVDALRSDLPLMDPRWSQSQLLMGFARGILGERHQYVVLDALPNKSQFGRRNLVGSLFPPSYIQVYYG